MQQKVKQRKEEAERQRERRDKIRQQMERDRQRLQQKSDTDLGATVAAASARDDEVDGSSGDNSGQSFLPFITPCIALQTISLLTRLVVFNVDH